MLIELKNFNNNITLALLILILNSYLFLSINLPIEILKINLVIFFTVFIYFYLKYFKYNFPLKLYFLLILLICLGEPAINWDLRSIYLFHAKSRMRENQIEKICKYFLIWNLHLIMTKI